MKLSISNIAWAPEDDGYMYGVMRNLGFSGLEIAPTRIFPTEPYSQITHAKSWSDDIKRQHGFLVSSMQSIWYGRSENIFVADQADVLIHYTKQVIDFADAVGCKNLVFGCPKNRQMPLECSQDDAIQFFKEITDYAEQHSVIIALEANPTIYGTNFINTTEQAFEFVRKIDSHGLKVNLDFGTIIFNQENFQGIEKNIGLINHVHISEPNLECIQRRKEHTKLAEILREVSYSRYISIEMKCQHLAESVCDVMEYIATVFK